VLLTDIACIDHYNCLEAPQSWLESKPHSIEVDSLMWQACSCCLNGPALEYSRPHPFEHSKRAGFVPDCIVAEAAECRVVRSSSKEWSGSYRVSTVENRLGKKGLQGSRGSSECCSGLLCDGSCGGSLSVTERNAVEVAGEGLRLGDVRVHESQVEGTNCLLGGFVCLFVLPD